MLALWSHASAQGCRWTELIARCGLGLCAALACVPGRGLAQGTREPSAASPTPEVRGLSSTPSHGGEPATREAAEESARYYEALADAPEFLPGSHLYWGTPVGPRRRREPLVFALEYALHLPVFNDLRNHALVGKHWAGAVTLSFEGALRMLSASSKPVRMPTYRPSLSAQVFYLWNRARPVLWGLRATAFHASNGQDRCVVDAAIGDETNACSEALRGTTDLGRALNRNSGSFATNGWSLAWHAREHWLNARRITVAHLAAGVSVEGNINSGPLAVSPAGLRRWYGWGRIGAELEGERLTGASILTLRGTIAGFPDSGPHVPVAAGSVEGGFAPYWLSGFGFFARYYGGRDFYNAFFVDRIHQFAAGLSWKGSRPLAFGESSQTKP